MRKLLIVDLEATCWERPRHEPEAMETIEIGALLVDPEDPARPSEYQGFVRPVRSPELSEFCKRLTREARITAIPLSVFYGEDGPTDLVRFAFCKRREVIEESARRLSGHLPGATANRAG